MDEIIKFYLPITNLSKDVYLNKSTDPLYRNLLTVREYDHLTLLYDEIPPKLLTRQLFKVIV